MREESVFNPGTRRLQSSLLVYPGSSEVVYHQPSKVLCEISPMTSAGSSRVL